MNNNMKPQHIHCNLTHEVFGKSKAQPKSFKIQYISTAWCSTNNRITGARGTSEKRLLTFLALVMNFFKISRFSMA